MFLSQICNCVNLSRMYIQSYATVQKNLMSIKINYNDIVFSSTKSVFLYKFKIHF